MYIMTSSLFTRERSSGIGLSSDTTDTSGIGARAANAAPAHRPCDQRTIYPTSSARTVLEILGSSAHPTELDEALAWLRRNFEPWMISTFEHRLY